MLKTTVNTKWKGKKIWSFRKWSCIILLYTATLIGISLSQCCCCWVIHNILSPYIASDKSCFFVSFQSHIFNLPLKCASSFEKHCSSLNWFFFGLKDLKYILLFFFLILPHRCVISDKLPFVEQFRNLH